MKIIELNFLSLSSVALIYKVTYEKETGIFFKKKQEYKELVFIEVINGKFSYSAKQYHTGKDIEFMKPDHLRDLIVNHYELTTPRNTIPHI